MYDYGDDVLGDRARHRRTPSTVVLRRGLVVEVLGDGFVGEVVGAGRDHVRLRDRRGRERRFGLDGSFVVDEEHVRLVLPAPVAPRASDLAATASGSVPAPSRRARVARASRIWVEGVHDAALVEKIWGDDLRAEAIVVEPLGGIDDLPEAVRAFGPGPDRRLGVLVDHLVPGSKESRIAASVGHEDVLITGHPFVDVWAAVRPRVLGLDAWPDVPVGEAWKAGLCRRLGVDADRFWPDLLGRVSSYTDLDVSLVGAVERLLDFLITEPTA